ncbi:MAG: hypothetical protein ACR2M4_11350 [Actinomycetota bacterium]
MDNDLTSSQVARELGTTRARVHRAVASSGVTPARTPGGHLRLCRDDLEALRRLLGFVPAIRGLKREEILVLAALSRRPLGLESSRAAARVSGVSPTSASKALANLASKGLASRALRRVVAGSVKDTEVWEATVRSPRWPQIAPLLARVIFPSREKPARSSTGRYSFEKAAAMTVAGALRHLFWNIDIGKLDLSRDAQYAAGRIIGSEDTQAHAWAAKTLPPSAFNKVASLRGISARRAGLARNLAHR